VTASPALLRRAEELLASCRSRGWRVATAESCTGGLVAALLTEIAGSSDVVECGFVTYSNEAKAGMLGVDPALIHAKGAVSEEVARAMAEGALARSGVDLTVSITGIAGPGGATATKPVGLVHFGLALRGEPTRHVERRYGDLGRAAVRNAAIKDALALLESAARA
jgi:nicotinamide-nucleotide amidase